MILIESATLTLLLNETINEAPGNNLIFEYKRILKERETLVKKSNEIENSAQHLPNNQMEEIF